MYELAELRQALSDLDLTYHRVRKLLSKEIKKHYRDQEEEVEEPPQQRLFPGYPFKVNDRVRIKNPKLNQQNSGVIIGRTGEEDRGFIKVRTANGKIINRGPQNISYL